MLGSSGSEQTVVSFDGTPIATTDDGGGPPVVLLHGFTIDSAHAWHESGMSSALRDAGRRAVTLDLRGHGRSGKPHGASAYQDSALARDVIAVAAALELERYDLVGYSLGAIVAGTVARLDENVRSLVLGGIGHLVMDPSWSRPSQLAAALEQDSPVSEPATAAMVARIHRSGQDRLALAGVQHGHIPLTAESLADISVPTLVICGVDDDVNGDADPLARAIPGARTVRMPGGHGDGIASPAFRKHVLAFLSEVSPVVPR